MHTNFCLESINRRDNLEGIDTDGRIIVKWILEREREHGKV